MHAWKKKKKPCLVQKWLMHERSVNEIKEIKRSEKEREQIFRWKMKGMIGQKVGSREKGEGE